eukprot:GILI01041634.1.p1 GENE.GILI01041634.1~~GILI01041634.1.p1  ORF type:complete len:305 (-),score=48.71 GILI01041634.1:11-790(-)
MRLAYRQQLSEGLFQDKSAAFGHEDARYVMCLLQDLNPTNTTLPTLEKALDLQLESIQAEPSRLEPLFSTSPAIDQRKAIDSITGLLVNDYTLRWATQLERMQCTLKAFTDIGGELASAQTATERQSWANSGGLPNPSTSISASQFEIMRQMLSKASGILERFFDEPYIALDGDLFPCRSTANSATLCVGMVDAAYCPISRFKRKSTFVKRNLPLMTVPDRGGRTNVSNFDLPTEGNASLQHGEAKVSYADPAKLADQA